jgi:hypothetical protein
MEPPGGTRKLPPTCIHVCPSMYTSLLCIPHIRMSDSWGDHNAWLSSAHPYGLATRNPSLPTLRDEELTTSCISSF